MKSVPTARRKHAAQARATARMQLLLAIGVLIVSAINLNIPYYALMPGPTEDVSRLIDVDGARTHAIDGRLLLTTVSLHSIRIGEAVRGWMDRTVTIVSRSAIVSTGETDQQVQDRTNAQMEESQRNAAASALTFLGYDVKVEPTGVQVTGVEAGAPAATVLRAGDLIVGADDKPVLRSEDLIAEVRSRGVGQAVRLDLRRGEKTVRVTVTTVGRPERPTEPVIGIYLTNILQVELPIAVKIDSLGIGGPSAGLMFALGIVDMLGRTDLARGRIIAGTGEIALDGVVTVVGGIHQKIESARRAGAELFLVPAMELKEACATSGDLPVVAVNNLREAVSALEGQKIPDSRLCRK